jgi:endoglucanase
MRFTDLLLASAGATLALAAPSTKRATGKFLFTGANESGGEFGEGNLPGQLNKDYIWPTTDSIDVRIPSMRQLNVGTDYDRLLPALV